MEDQVSAMASIYVPSADLVLTKTVDNTRPVVKDTVIFTLMVNNHGPDTAVDVTVNDKLPTGLIYDPNIEANTASAILNSQGQTVPVNAQAKTVGMQRTGAPIGFLILALLTLFAGMALPNRK